MIILCLAFFDETYEFYYNGLSFTKTDFAFNMSFGIDRVI